ncbi:hypothetical protein [Desulfatibacillum aliphaticivorans]|uniref:hypothetical protein n=1 Tax=Desulfatibacillum aliphaticivorans TaxID=218208 RepID=UPI0003FD4944|nr:hypothetical protein [Desulfatibacillum aliphaticivorans]
MADNISKAARRLTPLFCALLAAASLQACALWKKPAPTPGLPQAKEVIESIQKDYTSAGPFKGISRFTQEQYGNRLSGRAAFVVAPPDRLRVDILNPFGQPMVKMAYNGRHVFMYTGAEDKFRSGVATRGKMEDALGLPMSMEELAQILGGHAPVASHWWAKIEFWDFSGDQGAQRGFLLTLRSLTGRIREKIWVAGDEVTIIQADVYSSGKRLYSVFPDRDKPGNIRIQGEDGASITLEKQRFWENATVDESQFMLTKDMVTNR